MKTYVPMTCNILTPGHIRVIEKLSEDGFLVVGLLTSNALKGYKEELMPYEDREFILKSLKFPYVKIIPQDSLNPRDNIIEERCTAIASGDGWLPEELDCIKEFNLKMIDIKLDGEVEKQYSSSKIINKIKK